MKANWYLIIALTFVAHLTSCNEAPMSSKNNSAQLDGKEIDSAIKTVGNMRIFFGHQSVGKNILDGINDISKKTNHKVNLVKSREVIENTEAAFFHANVGKNQDPLSKIADFRELFENGMGGKVDVAFLKFCYVDFDGGTDIQSIFQQYRQTMKSLKKNYPQTTFAHFSVPLVNARLGIKDYIKKIIGKHNTKIEGNIKRNQFNEMLRAEYEGKEPIFDLAGIESTYPDGTRETFEKDGNTFYSLVPVYTDDGGHLNETGRKVLASKLLFFLASI